MQFKIYLCPCIYQTIQFRQLLGYNKFCIMRVSLELADFLLPLISIKFYINNFFVLTSILNDTPLHNMRLR